MAAPPVPKILRVAIVQGSKITEERLLRRSGDVTLGRDPKSTFVIPVSNLPPSFPVFEYRSNAYSLVFTPSMDGRVRLGTDDLSFEALRTQGLAKKRGEVYVFPLNDNHKGKITVGEITLLFQFVAPPPEPAKPELPPMIKGSVFKSMDQLFFGTLVCSLFFHFSGAGFIACQPKPVERELSLDELPDRFAKVLIPVKPPEPEKPKNQETQAADEAKKETKDEAAKKEDKTRSADPVERKAAIQQKVASKGLLRILGGTGAGSSALEDVLGGSSGAGDIASALAGAAGVGIATADALGAGGPKGGGAGNVAGIGDLGTSGGGNVDLGTKGDAKVSGHVKDAAPEVDSPDVDREALARYVRPRIKAIQGCYEKELKRNPSLKGKVVVRFSITPSGRTTDVEIEDNTLGNEAVASCIRAVIRGWIFPFKPDSDVPVAYPFVFSPAS